MLPEMAVGSLHIIKVWTIVVFINRVVIVSPYWLHVLSLRLEQFSLAAALLFAKENNGLAEPMHETKSACIEQMFEKIALF